MRNIERIIKTRVSFIQSILEQTGAGGIVYGNSGGKDSALVGILCKMACENTVGINMPGSSAQNYGSDKSDAEAVAAQFGIETRYIDLSAARQAMLEAIKNAAALSDAAVTNVTPRLRMTALYAVAASENRLVAGTGNKSEIYMGYFTKWGDGAYDFNPIADLAATEVFDILRHLKAPVSIIEKAPSGGLYEGQTDEGEMGVTYAAIDSYLRGEEVSAHDRKIIEEHHKRSRHKRNMPLTLG